VKLAISRVVSLSALALPLCAQSFDDLTSFRTQPMPYSQFIQVRAGVLGSMAAEKDPAVGLDDELGVDGSVFFHDAGFAGSGRDGQLDVYAGRDGLYAGLRDGNLISDTITRIELKARLWPFYREGFYRGDNFVPTGHYDGRDYEAYLGFGREVADQLFVEFGPFYRRNQFGETDDNTLYTPNYIVPADYAAYGARLFIEQRTTQLDRRSGLPTNGFCFSVIGEREWNDSSGEFGVNPGFIAELPSAVMRARGRIEWFIPQSTDVTWEIFASGMFLDKLDRVLEYEAQHLQGDRWVDAQLRLRFLLSDSFSLSPFVAGQFTHIQGEGGASAENKFFYGGGAEMWLHFSDMFSANAWYSYLNNESRPSVSISEDLHGEHMFWAGLVARFGAKR
jgi:hypothetical protein